MSERSAIEWTYATVNFWWGCTKVGPGCDHCYAETWDKRTGGSHWGIGVPRRRIESAGALIHRLDNSGKRPRVFIQSMSDLFDLEVPIEWFSEAWAKIRICDSLDVQIVTKRISAVEKRLAEIGETEWPRHAGLIITVVNQDEADRDVPRLLDLKAKLGIPWVGLSCEPLLGRIELYSLSGRKWAADRSTVVHDALAGFRSDQVSTARLDWVIAGGESGSKDARPMHPAWARSLRDQCAAAGTPFLFKQWGEWAPYKVEPGIDLGWLVRMGRVRIVHPTGQSDVEVFEATGGRNTLPSSRYMERVGKKAAGRLLDGVEHNGFPSRGSI